MMKKLRSRQGETLAEVLVGILMVAVSTSLFLGMVSAASHINRSAMEADTSFYKAMSHLECFDAEADSVVIQTGSLRVEGEDVSDVFPAEVFSEDGMTSYRMQKGGGTE